MLPIVWRAAALDDLTQIIQHIASVNPIAARRMKRLLEDSIVPAAEHPYLYRRSERVNALREIVAHPNYIVFYRVMSTCIEIVNVVHVRREFP
ncbi:MAG: type II toxin-antitoxin system RelE/ParE family toxin [Burkholderiales bacterium]